MLSGSIPLSALPGAPPDMGHSEGRAGPSSEYMADIACCAWMY